MMRFVVVLRTAHGTMWHAAWGWVTRAQHAAFYPCAEDAQAVAERMHPSRRATVVSLHG